VPIFDVNYEEVKGGASIHVVASQAAAADVSPPAHDSAAPITQVPAALAAAQAAGERPPANL
jgi:hypothetical protein